MSRVPSCLVVWIGVVLGSSGCLVTDPIDFLEENVPPRLVNDPAGVTPIGRIIIVDATESGEEVIFSVLVEDDNIGQSFEGMYRVVTRAESGEEAHADWGSAGSGRIPAPPERARIEIPHRVAGSGPGQCARLDLLVSSEFEPGRPSWERPLPVIENDVAFASWIIWFVDPEQPIQQINLDTCPTERPVSVP